MRFRAQSAQWADQIAEIVAIAQHPAWQDLTLRPWRSPQAGCPVERRCGCSSSGCPSG